MTPQTQRCSAHKPLLGRALIIGVQTSRKWLPQELITQLSYVAMAAVVIVTEYLLNVKCYSKYLALTVLESTL